MKEFPKIWIDADFKENPCKRVVLKMNRQPDPANAVRLEVYEIEG